MAWLDDNPPVRDQFRRPRREALSGVYGVHTFEGVKDDVGPDTGAENGARFIQGRADAGSYHDAIDSDSTIELVADDAEAFSIAADGHNRHTFNMSLVCRTVDLNPGDGWTRRAIALAGPPMVARWDRNGFCPTCSARWLTVAQVAALRARREPCPHGRWAGGLVCHGTVQPADRSDAWSRHPFRVELEQLLVDSILAAAGGPSPSTPVTAPQEDALMYVYQIAYDEMFGQLWLLWGYPNQLPHNGCYIETSDQVAEYITLYGATPIPGNQGALVACVLRMCGKPRPGQGQKVLTKADLDAQTEQIKASVKFLLESAGKATPDAETFANEVVDKFALRLAA